MIVWKIVVGLAMFETVVALSAFMPTASLQPPFITAPLRERLVFAHVGAYGAVTFLGAMVAGIWFIAFG